MTLISDTMIFEEQIARKPDHYPWTSELIEAVEDQFWTPKKYNFKSDYSQFKNLMPEVDKQMIVKTLFAIAQVEIDVKKFWARIGDVLPHPSIYDLGYVFAHNEVIHNRAYEKLLDTLNLGKAFEENIQIPIFRDRIKYLKKHLGKIYEEDKKQFIYSLILFTLFVENVSLFSQFYIILWYNRNKSYLKDTANQVQYTRNEEQLHALAGMKIINTIRDEHPELFDQELEDRIVSEAKEAFAAESKIVDWMLGDFDEEGVSGDRLNPATLKNFIKDRINDSMVSIGFNEIFELDPQLTDDSQWFREELLGYNMSDFFSKEDVNYQSKGKVFSEEELEF